uniref:HNH nuclease domain-containing protein n=1 Tax=viral metagenome TaxID=1070528 RepID=A0A6C0B8T4_9ZZZZ
MQYIDIHPTDRDDILKYVNDIQFPEKVGIDLFNSGTGSGKTRVMEQFCNKQDGCCIIVSPNNILCQQTMEVFKSSQSNQSIYLVNMNDVHDIQPQFSGHKKSVVFISGLGHNRGDYNKITKKLFKIIKALKQDLQISCTVLIDEIDQQFTQIIGGAQIRLEINKTNLNLINEFLKNPELSVCSQLKKLNTHVIGLSATLNNLICSKLPMLGYLRKEIRIFNVFPIKSLYSKLTIESVDTSNYESLVNYLENAESETNKKILLVFPDLKELTKFKAWYKVWFHREILSAEFTFENDKERNSLDFRKRLVDARYIIGINMLCTGFDLSSHVQDVEFNLGILFRRLSDKTTNPLSGNPLSDLYSKESSKLIQTISRLRKGGIFLVPQYFGNISTLFDIQYKVSMIIDNGRSEVDKIGTFRKNQVERYFQTMLLAILQNLRFEGEERKAVKKILTALKYKYGRNLKDEYENEDFDVDFWLVAYRNYLEEIMQEKLYKPNKIPRFSVRSNESHSLNGNQSVDMKQILKRLEQKHGWVVRKAQEVSEIIKPVVEEVDVPKQEDYSMSSSIPIVSKEETGGSQKITREVDEKCRANGKCEHCSKFSIDWQQILKKRLEQKDGSVVEKVQEVTESIKPMVEEVDVPKQEDYSTYSSLPILSKHETGGGERTTREVDEKVKKNVICRANGKCGHCSELIINGEDAQISHIRRFDEGGSYTEDNLVITHRECDAIYDSGKIIMDTDGTFWTHKMYPRHFFDKNQYKRISKENIQARWEWEKNTSKWPKRFTDKEFRTFLYSRGYLHCVQY